jgi:hypothetical protein
MADLGSPVRIKYLPSLAFSIAGQRSTNKATKPPGKNWSQGFHKRHHRALKSLTSLSHLAHACFHVWVVHTGGTTSLIVPFLLASCEVFEYVVWNWITEISSWVHDGQQLRILKHSSCSLVCDHKSRAKVCVQGTCFLRLVRSPFVSWWTSLGATCSIVSCFRVPPFRRYCRVRQVQPE